MRVGIKTLINPVTGKPIDPLPDTVQLSEKATRELREVLKQDIGEEALSKLSDKEVNHIGVLMLTSTSIQLKIKIREKKLERDLG